MQAQKKKNPLVKPYHNPERGTVGVEIRRDFLIIILALLLKIIIQAVVGLVMALRDLNQKISTPTPPREAAPASEKNACKRAPLRVSRVGQERVYDINDKGEAVPAYTVAQDGTGTITWNNPKPPVRTIVVPPSGTVAAYCQECGNRFYKKEGKEQRFCTAKCRYSHHNRNKKQTQQ